MASEMNSETGELIKEFKASKRSFSSSAFSSDDKILALASSKLRVLRLEDGEEILKFSADLVSRVELLDEVQVKAVNIANGKNLPEVPTLMFEFIGTEAYSREQTLIVQKIVSEYNGSDFIFAEDSDAKKELWKIRKEALWACFAMEPSFQAMFRDIDLLFIR